MRGSTEGTCTVANSNSSVFSFFLESSAPIFSDLFRIKGIAGQFAELLEASGVDTVKELRHRVAANLHAKLVEVNEARNLCNRVPAESEIQRMIDQAKELEPAISY